MRFQVKQENLKGGFRVYDSNLERDMCWCSKHGDALLISQALELQEVKTLEQMTLKLRNKKGEE